MMIGAVSLLFTAIFTQVLQAHEVLNPSALLHYNLEHRGISYILEDQYSGQNFFECASSPLRMIY